MLSRIVSKVTNFKYYESVIKLLTIICLILLTVIFCIGNKNILVLDLLYFSNI